MLYFDTLLNNHFILVLNEVISLSFASQVKYKYWQVLTAFISRSILIFKLMKRSSLACTTQIAASSHYCTLYPAQVSSCLSYSQRRILLESCLWAIFKINLYLQREKERERWKPGRWEQASLLVTLCCKSRLNFNHFRESTSSPEAEYRVLTSAGCWI